MQKQVSKQSLAIVALSILLTITMALTATFAAFSATNTTTGTITFIGGLTITAESDVADAGVTITKTSDQVVGVAFDNDAFQAAAGNTFVLTAAAKAVLAAYDLTATNSANKAATFTAELTINEVSNVVVTKVGESASYTKALAAKTGDTDTTATYNLSEIISEITVSDAIAANTTIFSIVFNANYVVA